MKPVLKAGWTEWQFPDPKGYFFQCCDCGLIHEMQFRSFLPVPLEGEPFMIQPMPPQVRTMFRVRRRNGRKAHAARTKGVLR